MNRVVLHREDWQDEAACRQVGTDLFFPASGDTSARAKAICKDCPVRVKCLEYALRTGQTYGVWGGLTTQERNQLGAEPIVCECGRVCHNTKSYSAHRSHDPRHRQRKAS